MANNVLFLRCDVCRAVWPLAKYWGFDWTEPGTSGKGPAKWLEEHQLCGPVMPSSFDLPAHFSLCGEEGLST